MTIQTDSFNASVDFIYTFNGENTGGILNLKVRYHMTETYGETITIWQEFSPGNFSTTPLIFPAQFFTEISNLLSKGINIGSTVIKESTEKKMIKKESKGQLPIPNVSIGNISAEIDDGEIESFSSVEITGGKDEEIKDNIKEASVAETLSQEQANKILEERKKAVDKAQKKKEEKTIKRA